MSGDTPFWRSVPALKQAALHIAYDNGMIFRDHTEALFLAETESALRKYSVAEVMAVERTLAAMNPDMLEDFCVGGDDGTRSGPADDMLNFIFEGDPT